MQMKKQTVIIPPTLLSLWTDIPLIRHPSGDLSVCYSIGHPVD